MKMFMNGGDGSNHLLEIICDADYAGQRDTRRSVSSVQLYLNGCLMESYVRCQRSIALSSGESEYVAMVGGCSKGLFLKHCWRFLTEEDIDMVCHSDSSAARSLAGRVGVGRTRHIAAGLLWLQQKVGEKELRVTGVPTSVNTSDIGTSILSKARMKGLKFLIKMIDGDDQKIGREEYNEIKEKEDMKKSIGKVSKTLGGNAKVAMSIAMALLQTSRGHEIKEISATSSNNTGTAINAESNDELWWTRAFSTVVALSAVGALSLARWAYKQVRQLMQWKQTKAGAPSQPSEIEFEANPEKIEMQWKIIQLEASCEEQQERVKELKEERDMWMQQCLEHQDRNVDLRGERDELRENYIQVLRQKERMAVDPSEKDLEIERLNEDLRQVKGAMELWKASNDELRQEAIAARQVARDQLDHVCFTLERQEWLITTSGQRYHHHSCGCIQGHATRAFRPCAMCIQSTIRGVTGFQQIPSSSA